MTDPKAPPTQVRFDYIKSNVFRVAHVDGAFGGPTAHGKIFLSLWSERPAIPVQVANRIEGNRLGEEIADQKVVRDAFVREVEVGLIMDPSVAKVLAGFLLEKIKLLEEVRTAPALVDDASAGTAVDAGENPERRPE